MADNTFTIGQSYKLPKNQFTNDSRSFKGWALTPKGSIVYRDQEKIKDITTTSNAVITLYAVWDDSDEWSTPTYCDPFVDCENMRKKYKISVSLIDPNNYK